MLPTESESCRTFGRVIVRRRYNSRSARWGDPTTGRPIEAISFGSAGGAIPPTGRVTHWPFVSRKRQPFTGGHRLWSTRMPPVRALSPSLTSDHRSPQWVSARQLCAHWGIGRTSLYPLMEAGLPSVVIGARTRRFDLIACDAWVAEHQAQGGGS